MEAVHREIPGSGLLPETGGRERDCLISRRDLEILIRGSETEKEKGYRNLASAIAAGSGLGVASTVTSHFGELWTVGLAPAEAIFLIVTLSTTMASSVLALFFHRRARRDGAADHRLLEEQIRFQLETASEDPCYWP